MRKYPVFLSSLGAAGLLPSLACAATQAAGPAAGAEPANNLMNLVSAWLPMLVLVAVWVLFVKKSGTGTSKTAQIAEEQLKTAQEILAVQKEILAALKRK